MDDALAIIEELGEAEIERLVAFLPENVRLELAAGPMPEPFCAVCRALETLPSSGPAMTLLDYHDTPFRRRLGTTHRVEGRETYERCCEIYRAAGWTGEIAQWARPA